METAVWLSSGILVCFTFFEDYFDLADPYNGLASNTQGWPILNAAIHRGEDVTIQ